MVPVQGIFAVICEGEVMVIAPPHEQVQVEEMFRAGIPPSITVGEPGAHGATVTGMQGIGVRTPSAAAVAAATVGFEGDMHIPKVGMFTIGLLSMMQAAGVVMFVLFNGSTASAAGAAPKLHIIIVPVVTNGGINGPLCRQPKSATFKAENQQHFTAKFHGNTSSTSLATPPDTSLKSELAKKMSEFGFTELNTHGMVSPQFCIRKRYGRLSGDKSP
jgi:hypothetical protein